MDPKVRRTTGLATVTGAVLGALLGVLTTSGSAAALVAAVLGAALGLVVALGLSEPVHHRTRSPRRAGLGPYDYRPRLDHVPPQRTRTHDPL